MNVREREDMLVCGGVSMKTAQARTSDFYSGQYF
jgi:hypothetical protein